MGFFKKRLQPSKLRIFARSITTAIAILALTWRVTISGQKNIDGLISKKEPFVLVFWHGDMLMGWYFHRNYHFTSLVSMSRDGDLLAEVLGQWKYEILRGSSSKGGQEARAQLERVVREGKTIVVTPDGPRGPVYEMKMGALRIAQKTGVPLVSVTFTVRPAFRLRSWDRFTVPGPFAKIMIQYHRPEYINPGFSRAELEQFRQYFQNKMKSGVRGVS